MRKLTFILPLIAAMAMMGTGCNSDNSSTGTDTQSQHKAAHEAPPEVEQKIIDDITGDLQIIAAAGGDANQLANAMTGTALEQTKNTIAADLAQGKIRKRDYQNINVRVQDYTLPVAETFAEFDDNGYYTDAKTGAQLGAPTNEHKSYALAVVEEAGRWKIKLILSPTATSTTSTTPS